MRALTELKEVMVEARLTGLSPIAQDAIKAALRVWRYSRVGDGKEDENLMIKWRRTFEDTISIMKAAASREVHEYLDLLQKRGEFDWAVMDSVVYNRKYPKRLKRR